MRFRGFHADVYELVQRLLLSEAKSVTIKTKEGAIVFKTERGALVARIYSHDSLHQAWYHGKNSITELLAAFECVGVCLKELVKLLLPCLFRKRKQPLLVDLSQ